MSDKNVYFAAKPSKECLDVLADKINAWTMTILSSGLADKVQRSTNFYYGSFNDNNLLNNDGHLITYDGDQGELVRLPVNHFRNIAQHLLNMITTNRPALQARAINTDYKSLTQTQLANGLLDYYMREKYLEDIVKKATEYSIVTGEGWVKLGWDATAGEEVMYDEERESFVYEGDIKYKALNIFDVIRDPYKDDETENDWLIVKTYANKFDLAAKYPDHAEDIIKRSNESLDRQLRISSYRNQDSDEIPVYEFFHKKTDAMPDGRYMYFVDADISLIDMAMPYRQLPLYKIQPACRFGTPFGYTAMFDLIPLQESVNMLYSIIMTNQNAFGVQNILIPKGADINYTQLSGGLNVLEYMPGMGDIKALQLTATPAEVFGMIDRIQAQMETISGINSVTRGNPEASLRSGNALALIQAQAVQFMSSLQQSYVRLVESCGTGTIKMLQDFADVPRIAAIVGKSNEPYMKEFVGKDLQYINRVVVDMVNPVAKTTAGRLEMATNLLQYGAIKDPYQYMMVLNTGKLETMTENAQKELLLISKENEKMLVGEKVLALALDSHLMHIKEHKAMLYDPDLRKNGDLVANCLEHIDEHFRLLQDTDPAKLQLLGEQPLPPPQPMAPAQPGQNPLGQGEPQAPGAAPGAGPQPIMQPLPTGAEAAQNVSEQNMPRPPEPFSNMPITGQGGMDKIINGQQE